MSHEFALTGACKSLSTGPSFSHMQVFQLLKIIFIRRKEWRVFFCEEKAYPCESAVGTDHMFSALIWASNVCLYGRSTQSKLTQNYSFSYGDYKWISNIRKLWNPNAQNFPNAQKYYVYFKRVLKIHSSTQLCLNIHFLISERNYIVPAEAGYWMNGCWIHWKIIFSWSL